MAARPIVLPDPYNGEGSWEEWTFHFENIAVVNGWDDAQKLKFLRVRLTGRAQKALQRMPEATRSSYTAVRCALQERFEPGSRRTRYQAEFQTRRKKTSEGWADFAEDLKFLAEKGFPELQEEATELLAVNAYLQQLNHPQVAFSVRQRRPKSVDEAVSATLEMESYVSTRTAGLSVASVGRDSADDVTTGELMKLVEKLMERIEVLERQQSQWRDSEGNTQHVRRGSSICRCQKLTYIAENGRGRSASISSVAMERGQGGNSLDGSVDGHHTSITLGNSNAELHGGTRQSIIPLQNPAVSTVGAVGIGATNIKSQPCSEVVAAGAGGGEGTPGKEKSSRTEKIRVQRETDKRLKMGTLVWIHSPDVGNSNVAFEVVRQISNTVYRVQSIKSRRYRLVVDRNKLKSRPPDNLRSTVHQLNYGT